MYYIEYLGIREGFIDKQTIEWRAIFLIDCVRYYILGQFEGDQDNDGRKILQKPCLLLDKNNKCMSYADRPLKCRTYGLVPADMHRRIVSSVSEDSKIPKKNLPLCIQCPFVKIIKDDAHMYPDDVISSEEIAMMEKSIRTQDQVIGISKGFQDIGLAFLTLHDWHIMSEMGEEWMTKLTPIRANKVQEWKNKFLDDLSQAVFSNMGLGKK
jgi:hypothetical protein